MSDSPTIGKVLYFDPNNSIVDINGNISDKPSDLMQNPEDLCIGVDLQVTVKNQSNITSSDKKTTYNLIGPNTKINFLEGENLGGVNVLTDFFANLGDKDNDVENIHEAMCVSSIDIEFSSWYAASVVINFTDVRGASLMSSADYVDTLKDSNLSVGDKNQSLFKSFFDFPYPIYILKIKGFYGDAVSYPLHCSDFKATFNATTGNFDIVVSFIGYTYAMLNDVQMSYLMAAPYCKFAGAGSDYWDAQVANGRFLSSDGSPLPKLVSLMNKVKEGDYQIKKISQNSVSSGLQEKKNERYMLFDIKDNYLKPYLSEIKTTYNSGIYDYELNLVNINSKAATLIDGTLNNILNTQIDNIDKKILEYKEIFPTSIVFNSYSGKSWLKPKKSSDGNFEVIFKPIGVAMVDLNNKLTEQIADLSNLLNNEKNNSLTEVYEMKPNIYNYFKVLVAHMETFYNLIYICKHKIPEDRHFDKNMGLNSTDLKIKYDKQGQPILSPFPWYSQLGKDGRMEDAWIGEVAPNLLEVELIDALINAKTDIQKELDKIKVNEVIKEPNNIDPKATVTIGELYYPMNAFDNTINLIGGKTENPYKDFKENDINTIYDRLFLRTYISNLLSGAATHVDYNQNFALAESRNIFEEVGGNTFKLEQIQNQIRVLDGKTVTDMSKYNNTFRDKWANTDKWVSKFLPLFEDINVNYTSYGKQVDLLEKRNKHWVSFDPDYNGQLFKKQTNFSIVEGTENANKITNDYYLKIINNIKNSGQNFDKIMNNYYFIDDKNDPISYKYIGGDSSGTNIFNKICEAKRHPLDNVKAKENSVNTNAFIVYDKAKINPKFIYQESINFDTLYNIYLPAGGKILNSNSDIFKNYQKSKDPSVSNNYSYPFIGGYYFDIPFSLFGHPFYYNQAGTFNTSNDKNLQVSDFHKAILFLNSLNINVKETESLFLENKNNGVYNSSNYLNRASFMARLPKASILLIGGMLWQFNNSFPFKGLKGIKLPNRNQYFKKNNLFTLIGEEQTSVNYENCNLFFKDENNQSVDKYKSIFSVAEEDFLIKEFTNWAIIDWQKIKNQFELRIKTKDVNTNKTVIGPRGLKSLVENISEIYLENNISNLYNYINISNNNFIERSKEIEKEHSSQYKALQVLDFLILINKDDTVGVKTIINLLLTDCVLAYSGNNMNGNIINVSTMQKTMLSTINNNLGSIKNPSVQTALGITNIKNSDKKGIASIDYNPDMKLAVYSYIKTLNDKWVSGFSDPSEYQWITSKKDINTKVSQFKALPNVVGDYYIRNFRFIDRAHNDIGVDMLINYRQLFDLIDSNTTQKTLFSAMTDVLQQNQMLFLPMPSYQSFDNAKDFSKIFKPIPFVESKLMTNDVDYDTSMYLCMYAGRPSSKLDQGKNGMFDNDGYSFNKPHELPSDYKTHDNNQEEQAQVPAIAVNFGQQNQQYFKNVQLNMSNPNTTDASIRILKNLNDRASQNATVEPIGQDLFSLYSQYSYSCEVEMMGCPQIQPMMYFQLNNIPMWNGAYMIFKIKHSIKPGTMTTSFTGMRMAKTYPKLISQNAISFKLVGDLENYGNFTVPVEGKDEDKFTDITAPENSKLKFIDGNHFFVKDYFVFGGEGLKGKKVTEKVYNRISYLSQVVEKIYSEWTGLGYNSFNILSAFRDKLINGNNGSAHLMGLGVDIQIPTDTSKDAQNSLFSYIQTMMTKGLPIDQLILETRNSTSYLIHIGLASQTGNKNDDNRIPKIESSRYVSRGEVKTINYKTDNNKYTELTKIPEAMWPQTGEQSIKDTTKPTNTKDVQLYVKTTLKNSGLSKFQVAGVMGNIYQESTFNLNANPATTAHNMYYGLIQWSLASYNQGGTYEGLKTKVGNTKESQMTYLINHTNGYSNFVNLSQSSKTPEEASLIFSNKVEICGKSCVNADRDAFSRSFYQRFNDPNDYLYWG